jgi:hypothetical protein
MATVKLSKTGRRLLEWAARSGGGVLATTHGEGHGLREYAAACRLRDLGLFEGGDERYEDVVCGPTWTRREVRTFWGITAAGREAIR